MSNWSNFRVAGFGLVRGAAQLPAVSQEALRVVEVRATGVGGRADLPG